MRNVDTFISDMSIVKPLLQLHTLLFSLPPPATIANTMSTLQHTIANILLTFTTGEMMVHLYLLFL